MKGLSLGLVAALTVAASSPAAGQTPGAVRLGVSIGATVPLGDFADANNAGYHFGGHLTTGGGFLPGSLRLEIIHNRMKHDATSANTLVTSGTVNAVFSGAAGGVTAPYGIVGLGGYYIQTALRGPTPGTTRYDNVINFGLNGGAGIRFPLAGFDTFAEARLHWVKTDDDEFFGSSATYLPLTFGITF